jgi:hypothetical protein
MDGAQTSVDGAAAYALKASAAAFCASSEASSSAVAYASSMALVEAQWSAMARSPRGTWRRAHRTLMEMPASWLFSQVA